MTRRSLPLQVLVSAALAGGALTGPAALHAQPASATIHGTVVSQDGNPVPNAEVIYARVPRTVQDARGTWTDAPNQPYVSSKTIAAAYGGFAASDLPEGKYRVCVGAPGFLRSCDWSGWLTVKAAPGGTVSLPEVRLAKAAVLRIRVNDPSRLLPPDDRISRPLVVGIMDEYGSYHAAVRIGRIPWSRLRREDRGEASPRYLRLFNDGPPTRGRGPPRAVASRRKSTSSRRIQAVHPVGNT